MNALRPMTLTIVVEFPNGLSDRAQQLVKEEIHEFKDRLHVGAMVKMVKAELVTLPQTDRS